MAVPSPITGTISIVKPDEGLLVVVNEGAGHSTDVSGAAVTTQNSNGSTTTTDTDVVGRAGALRDQV